MFEALGFTLAELQHFLLILLRTTTLTFTITFFSSKNIPAVFKFFLGVFLALVAFPILPIAEVLPLSFLELTPFAFKEVLIGLGIGLTTRMILEVLSFAGFFASRIMGLSMLTMIDPTSDENIDALGQIFYLFAMMLMLSTNAHHFFIKTIFNSFYLIPVTKGVYSSELTSYFVKITAGIFVTGFKIAAPIVVLLFLQKVLLALFAKVSPEMNVFIIGMPLGILVGFYVLTYYWPFFNYTFFRYFESLKVMLTGLLKLLGGG